MFKGLRTALRDAALTLAATLAAAALLLAGWYLASRIFK